MRIIQKGNLKDIGYDLRIIEEEGKEFYYHILLLDDGESIIQSKKPFNLKGSVNVLWEELPIKVRDEHFNAVYPNGLSNDFKKNCFLYGIEKAKEISEIAERKQIERKRLTQKLMSFPISYSVAEQIYDAIGEFTKVEIIFENGLNGKYIVDDEKIVVIRKLEVISVKSKAEEDSNKANWGKRVNKIAKLAGTNYNIATIVGDITDIDDAVQTLKEVLNILNDDYFIEQFNRSNLGYLIFGEEIPIGKIKDFFEHKLSWEIRNKLKFNKKFYTEVEKILHNQK